jgi:membrane fusion protein, multidrug efflux system
VAALVAVTAMLWSMPAALAQTQPRSPNMSSESGRDGTLRVLVTASREATISGQLDARILFAGPGDGEAFRKGAPLIRFDCSIYNAALAEARAEQVGAKATLATKEKLDRLGSSSGLELELAKAAVAKAGAAVTGAEWRVRQCQIRAPFDGRVVKRMANTFEVVRPGQELTQIVSTQDLEVRVIVPSRWSARLVRGETFEFVLEETGKTYRARVISLGAKIDPASQSIELRGKILEPSPEIIIGMSGTARMTGR